ncbi:MAG: glycoside hydrolase family 44 protein [Hallerella succinigenes]|uniref:glycoside hydrolase family 44 protein n=1 Tax=Hallerella succinigenes TaxID=1896222 RepID=UPI0023F595ED|nr:glycoside hydrolase family 44 protein [Hallerella succinigenes]MDD6091504.1 glycoside hydrolase family 44 protein [Hallerella succinigenes]
MLAAVMSLPAISLAAIEVRVDSKAGIQKISPYIFGKNISGLNDAETSDPAKIAAEDSTIKRMNEIGFRFFRANNGNNATRYNWRKKLTVHPDWYNNVYAHDWDITAKTIQDKLPGANAMYAFQLSGYAASSADYNFNDWDFFQTNGSWAKSTLDLAGGGVASADGQTALKTGNYSLYNEEWPADSTVAILNHWKDDVKLDMKRFEYWSMDNEMEIWSGTHSDLPLTVTQQFLVERYLDVAKKAKKAWKDIKLTGPVAANEWQWCGVDSDPNAAEERNYCWLEYFIKKVAEAQKASGVKLLDVLDIHWYPTEKTYEDRINWHRVFFDTTYVYPGANGIKKVNGGWDNSIVKEFIFKRLNDWMNAYFGKNHGIGLGLTETDLTTDDAMLTALIYASFLGTFMDNGVELFTPWSWGDGMDEVAHLFIRYGHEFRVASTSSNDSLVSAYSSVTESQDSMTIILVNRSEKMSQTVNLYVENFEALPQVQTLTLSDLSGETFVSHTENALRHGTAVASDAKFSLELPAKSITALLLIHQNPTSIPKKTLRSVKKKSGTPRYVNGRIAKEKATGFYPTPTFAK